MPRAGKCPIAYKIPDDIVVDDAALLTDALPTGYQAAEMADIHEGDTVVVFGAGPVGIFAARPARLFGAGRVIVVEGIVDDLRHGHLPDVLGEMGIRSELRYNPAGLVRKTGITAIVVGGATALLKRRR